MQEEADLLFADAGLRQLLQSGLRGFRQNPLLDRVEQIADAGVGLLKLLLIHRQRRTFLILQGQHHRGNCVDGAVISQHLYDGIQDQVFEPNLTHWFALTSSALLFYRYALVIVVDFARPACAALTAEVSAAIAAEDPGGKQIIVLGLVTGRGLFVDCQFFLHAVEQVLRYDSRNTVRDHGVPESKLPDITPIVENMLDGAVGDWIILSLRLIWVTLK